MSERVQGEVIASPAVVWMSFGWREGRTDKHRHGERTPRRDEQTGLPVFLRRDRKRESQEKKIKKAGLYKKMKE